MRGTQQEIILKLAQLLANRQKPEAIGSELWPDLIETALDHDLGMVLLWGLKQADFNVPLTPSQRLLLLQMKYLTTMHSMVLQHAQLVINEAFRQADIRALWLKGSVLARTVYPEPELRPMADLDVLVPYEKRHAALVIAQKLGYDFYQPAHEVLRADDDIVLKQTHHYHLQGGSGNRVYLEIHFRLLGVDGKHLLPDEHLNWFWEQTKIIAVPTKQEDDSLLLIPTPEAHLLYLCAHAILQHGEGAFILMRYFDLHLLISKNEINWQQIINQAIVLKWTYAIERGLANAIHYFGTPIPGFVLDELRSKRPDDEDVLRGARLQGKYRRWEHSLIHLKTLPFKDKARLVYKILFPSRLYMRQRYLIQAHQPVWPYYLYRWFAQGRIVIGGIWSRFFQDKAPNYPS